MHVVIVGGGFGGVKAALELSKRQIGRITLISDETYFLHHATLYATATGKNFAESVIPLNTIFTNHPNVEIVHDKVTSFNPTRRLITGKKTYHYDKLVLALGAVTTYFGIKGMEQHAFGIKSIHQIKQFQEHIHEELVQKKLDKEYFVIGAGSTGIEIAAALNNYLKLLAHTYRLTQKPSKVTLVEASARVAPHLSQSASDKVSKRLKKQGITIRVNHPVNGLTKDSVTVDGKPYETSTAIWTSGVANNPFFQANSKHFQLANNGRVIVNSLLEATDNVYVIGDNNTVKYSGTSWPAMAQARHVAKNISRIATNRQQVTFIPRSAPSGLPLSDTWGYVEWHGVYAAGRTGAFLRRMIELYGYCQIVPYKQALPVWRAHHLAAVEE